MTVLFLGESNAVRSPLAEAVARHLDHRAGGREHEFVSAGWAPTHVRAEVRKVLEEEGIPALGLRAKGLGSISLDEVDVVVNLVEPKGPVRVPARARRLQWLLPDPSSAPPEERMEAYRAARDELARRIRNLLAELDA
jgi:protein-tyrosine-phosphatase